METSMAAVLYSLLVSVVISSAMDPYSDPSMKYSEVAMLQAANINRPEICPVSGTMEVCQSASRITSSKETFYVHVCPADGISCTPELCYISTVPECFIQEIYNPRTKCNSTSNLLVAGRSITVTFYEIDIGDIVPQDCFVIFDSNGSPDRSIKSCSEDCDSGPQPPVIPPTLSPPTTTQPAFCRDNCRRFLPPQFGGCLTCQRGFTNPPRCCDPTTTSSAAVANAESAANQRPHHAEQSNLEEELFTAIDDVLAKFQT